MSLRRWKREAEAVTSVMASGGATESLLTLPLTHGLIILKISPTHTKYYKREEVMNFELYDVFAAITIGALTIELEGVSLAFGVALGGAFGLFLIVTRELMDSIL